MRKRRGLALPGVLVATVLLSVGALLAARLLRDHREAAMVEAARRDVVRMMSAIDKYQTLYNRLPDRLTELDRVGYHEAGGLIVCRFEPDSSTIDLAVKHRSARAGVMARYPASDDVVPTHTRLPDCSSARRRE